MDRLKIVALDEDDLAIMSAHCQDAVMKLADCRFLPGEQRFVMEMNRFVWEKARTGRLFPGFGRRREFERRRSVLHFERVSRARRIGFSSASPDTVLDLLAIRFNEADPPSGSIELVFAGGSAIRLDVEVIEARLSDLGPAWSTTALPDHDRPAS